MTQGGTAIAAALGTPVDAAPALRFLLIEDSDDDSELVTHQLKSGGFHFTSETVKTAEQFRQAVRAVRPDIILADYNLGEWRGMDALDILRELSLDIPLILVTGALGEVTAVDCIKQGAADYILKSGLTRLPLAIRRTLEDKRLREQRRQAEEELAAKVKELARSNRDLEQFAFVASHDLQEPLRMVAAYTQLLAERYRGKLDENADKYIGYAVEGALRMQALIRDMLAFSRVGRTASDRSHANCNVAVGAALLNLRAMVEETGTVVTYDQLPAVAADPTQLIQLFQNLIGNAVKFRGKEKPLIRVSAERRDDRWQFAVADNGIGIAPEHKDIIFVIFQRLHARSEYEGNGLGLAICQKIIEQNGGKIWVESDACHGSTFRFTLPAVVAKEGVHDRRDKA
jgi:signal transduction histidine kinase